MLYCYGLGLCVASRQDVETPTRGSWKLSDFLWFRPAAKTRSFRIHLTDDLALSLVRHKSL